jgi:hypothetical protein
MSAILEAVEFVSEPNRGGSHAQPAVPMLASGMGEFRRLERRLWMIRANRSPRRLGGMGLAVILLAAGAALPIAPSLAREDVAKTEESRKDEPTTDKRDVIVTPTTDPLINKATITFSDGGHLLVAAPEGPGRADNAPKGVILDARTGNVIEYDGAGVRIVAADDVDAARAEVEHLSEALAKAKARLKELEKRGKDREKEYKAKKAEKDGGDVGPKGVLRLNVKREDDALLKSKPEPDRRDKFGGDQERRLERLEQKLEKLDAVLDELRELKKQERGIEKDGDKAPRKF